MKKTEKFWFKLNFMWVTSDIGLPRKKENKPNGLIRNKRSNNSALSSIMRVSKLHLVSFSLSNSSKIISQSLKTLSISIYVFSLCVLPIKYKPFHSPILSLICINICFDLIIMAHIFHLSLRVTWVYFHIGICTWAVRLVLPGSWLWIKHPSSVYEG